MNLQEFLQKSKGIGVRADRAISGNVLTLIIIVLVAFASYGLGRLSKIESSKEPIRLIDNSSNASAVSASGSAPRDNQTEEDTLIQGKYVASRNGTKYHLPWCSSAQRIKEENKIWFNTKEEAERAGYGPAANCKGI